MRFGNTRRAYATARGSPKWSAHCYGDALIPVWAVGIDPKQNSRTILLKVRLAQRAVIPRRRGASAKSDPKR